MVAEDGRDGRVVGQAECLSEIAHASGRGHLHAVETQVRERGRPMDGVGDGVDGVVSCWSHLGRAVCALIVVKLTLHKCVRHCYNYYL